MLQTKSLKQVAVVVLIFFSWFTFMSDLSFAASEDTIEKKLKTYIQNGDYEAAINMLKDYIDKVKDLKAKRKNLAEAYYHLARTNFQAGLEGEVDNNLSNAYNAFPALDIESSEQDLYFKERAVKVKNQVIKNKMKQPVVVEKTTAGKDASVEKKVASKKIIERPAKKSAIKKKKKFPWLLVIGGLVVVGAVLYFLVLKKDDEVVYDIRGTWQTSRNYYDGSTGSGQLTFWGNLNSGQCTVWTGYTGTYTVTGTSVVFDDGYTGNVWTFRGTFTSLNSLSGTFYDDTNSAIGNWNATKLSAAGKTKNYYRSERQTDLNKKKSKKSKSIFK